MTIDSKSLNAPELADVLNTLKDDILKSMNCVKIGTIKKFSATKKTAEVQLAFKRVLPDNTIKSMPVLVDCPVFTPQGGGAALTLPITAGDECLVLFSDRNIDAWFQNGGEAAPFDGRLHDLSDGIALVGVNYLGSSGVQYDALTAALSFGGAKISIKDGKIVLSNVATDLKTVLVGLITVIQAITVQDISVLPLTAASIAALESYKATVATLLGEP